MEKLFVFIQIMLRVSIAGCLIGIMLMSFRLIEIHNKLSIDLIELTNISQELDQNIHELEIINSHNKL